MTFIVMDYSDVTIGQFMDIHLIQSQYKGDFSDIIANQKIYSILTGIPQSEIDMWTPKEWFKKSQEMNFLSEEPAPKKLTSDIEIKSEKFKRVLDARKISFGRYIDLMETSKEDGKLSNMHKLMALILEHKTMDFEQRSEFLHDHMTIDEVLPHLVFFSKVLIELTNNLPAYLNKEIQTMIQTMKSQGLLTNSYNIGDGL